MKNILKNFAILFGSTLCIFSCSSKQPMPIEIGGNEIAVAEASDDILVTQSQFEMAEMQLGKLTDYSFPTTIQVTGRIEIPSKNQIRVSAYAGGYVTNINLIPGEKVGKGQVLFTLENPEFVQMQQDYLEAKEQLTYLQSDYERQKTLANENVTSQKSFLKAEAEYRVTLAKMEGMKKRLSLINIPVENITTQNLISSISVFAPTSGYVTEVHAMKGMFLSPTDVGVEIINTDDMHLELNIFEKDILKIKEGQNITFSVPDGDATTYQAKVHLIGKIVDAEKRAVRVHADLKNKKDKAHLIDGMYVNATIFTADNKAMGLPESAIVSEDEKDYVLVSMGKENATSKFMKKEVMLGQKLNGFVQIMNYKDFMGTENILTNGAFNLIGIE